MLKMNRMKPPLSTGVFMKNPDTNTPKVYGPPLFVGARKPISAPRRAQRGMLVQSPTLPFGFNQREWFAHKGELTATNSDAPVA